MKDPSLRSLPKEMSKLEIFAVERSNVSICRDAVSFFVQTRRKNYDFALKALRPCWQHQALVIITNQVPERPQYNLGLILWKLVSGLAYCIKHNTHP